MVSMHLSQEETPCSSPHPSNAIVHQAILTGEKVALAVLTMGDTTILRVGGAVGILCWRSSYASSCLPHCPPMEDLLLDYHLAQHLSST